MATVLVPHSSLTIAHKKLEMSVSIEGVTTLFSWSQQQHPQRWILAVLGIQI